MISEINMHCPVSASDGGTPFIAPRKISIAPEIGFRLRMVLIVSFFIIVTG
jgi:hypothetical protein